MADEMGLQNRAVTPFLMARVHLLSSTRLMRVFPLAGTPAMGISGSCRSVQTTPPGLLARWRLDRSSRTTRCGGAVSGPSSGGGRVMPLLEPNYHAWF